MFEPANTDLRAPARRAESYSGEVIRGPYPAEGIFEEGEEEEEEERLESCHWLQKAVPRGISVYDQDQSVDTSFAGTPLRNERGSDSCGER